MPPLRAGFSDELGEVGSRVFAVDEPVGPGDTEFQASYVGVVDQHHDAADPVVGELGQVHDERLEVTAPVGLLVNHDYWMAAFHDQLLEHFDAAGSFRPDLRVDQVHYFRAVRQHYDFAGGDFYCRHGASFPGVLAHRKTLASARALRVDEGDPSVSFSAFADGTGAERLRELQAIADAPTVDDVPPVVGVEFASESVHVRVERARMAE